MVDVVTGAFSFTGRYLAQELLERGHQVRTLSGHPDREAPFAGTVPASGFHFDDPAGLRDQFRDARTLYNTYWIRFEQGQETFAQTLERTRILVQAASEAGVARVVHFSSSGADPDSELAYFRAKGEAERLVAGAGMAYTIIRPTLLFGQESLLFNNLAWMLRHLPVFAIPGDGEYSLQPLHVADLARFAVELALAGENRIVAVGGPEVLSFNQVVTALAQAVDSHARIVHVAPKRLLQLGRLFGGMVDDTLLTADELEALRRNLLVAEQVPEDARSCRRWLQEAGPNLGDSYRSSKEYFGEGGEEKS